MTVAAVSRFCEEVSVAPETTPALSLLLTGPVGPERG
jgi:hypothetical protein